MSNATVTATCKCGHPEDAHNALWPAGACTACTQCDGLLAERLHTWKRCRCEVFTPATPLAEIYGKQLDDIFEAWAKAEAAGEAEVIEPRSEQ